MYLGKNFKTAVVTNEWIIQLLIIICTATSSHTRIDTEKLTSKENSLDNEVQCNLYGESFNKGFYMRSSCKGNVFLTCSADLQWYHLSEDHFNELINSNKEPSPFFVIKTPEGNHEILRSITKDDIGWYLGVLDQKIPKISYFLNVTCENNDLTHYDAIEKIQNGTAPPYFTGEKYSLKYEGSNLIIACYFRGYPPPTITWLKNGLNHSNQSTLEISNNNSNSGTYTCDICNWNGCVNQTFTVELTKNKPVLIKATKNIIARVGQSINLTCDYSSDSLPWYTKWDNTYETVYSPEGWHETSKNYKEVLELNRLTKEHQGEYKCKAANLNEEMVHLIRLAVTEDDPKTFFRCHHSMNEDTDEVVLGKSKNFTILCGDDFFFKCDLSMKKKNLGELNLRWYHLPEESFEWNYYTDESSPYQFQVQNTNPKDRLSLQLNGVTINDTGWYSGVLDTSNNAAIVVQSFWLQVNCENKNPPQSTWINLTQKGANVPYFISEPTVKYSRNAFGETLCLSCQVRGYPWPNISWIRNNLTVNEISAVCSDNMELCSKNNIPRSENYTCVACNRNGCINHSYKIEISPNHSKPVLKQVSQNTSVRVGQTITLTCEFSSESLPWFTIWETGLKWSANRKYQKVFDPETHSVNTANTTFEINAVNTDDHGSYRCSATNINGETQQELNVTVISDVESQFICYNQKYPFYPITDREERFTEQCGGMFSVKCKIDVAIKNNSTKDVVRWYHQSKDNLRVRNYEEQNRKHEIAADFLQNHSEVLQLPGLASYDTGRYSAVISTSTNNTVGRIMIRTINLQVNCNEESKKNKAHRFTQRIQEGAAPPYFTLEHNETAIIIEQEETVCLICNARGYPTPAIRWSVSDSFGNVIHSETYDKYEYCISRQNYSYTGYERNYECSATNTNGAILRHYTVRMSDERPILVDKPENVTKIGKSFKLICAFNSTSTPWITTWETSQRNAKEVIKEVHNDTSATTTFTLDNVTIHDQGLYVCLAININGNESYSVNLTVVNNTDESITQLVPMQTPTTPKQSSSLITILIIALILLIATSIFTYCLYHRLRKRRRAETEAITKWVKQIVIKKEVDLDEHFPESLMMPIVTIERFKARKMKNCMLSQDEYELPLDENWEFPREKLVLGKILGEGEFGKVFQGEADGILENGVKTTVAVKMLKDNYNDLDMIDLVSEIEIMKLIGNHRNILSLLGCCSRQGPLYAISEYAANGNLRDFLRRHEEHNVDIARKTLLSFAIEIATGMEYLSSIRCIHRDLAARNILVSEDYTMKIADFGLARDIRNIYYYKKTTEGRLPIRWMAPESIFFNRYTIKSDVWSFGILLWEIETLGGVPYPSIFDTDVLLEALREGHRMQKPSNSLPQTYRIMMDCWKYNPTHRPDFSAVLNTLENILQNFDNLTQSVLQTSDDAENCFNSDSELEHLLN